MISVLITHHKPELEKYLLRACESLRMQQNVDFRGHIVSSAQVSQDVKDFVMSCDGELDIYEMPELDTPTAKVNFWLDNLLDDATHTMMMSNDVILSSNALEVMESVQGECIQTPLSNNENLYRFFMQAPWQKHQYDLDEISMGEVINYRTGNNVLIVQPWVSFYTPFITRSVWDKVGRLDPVFDMKYNDSDFCFRAKRLSIPTIVNTGCFALHYGSKTTKGYMDKESELAADQAFVQRYTLEDLVKLGSI